LHVISKKNTSSRTKTTTKARGKKTAAVKFDKSKYRKLVADALPAVVETESELSDGRKLAG
jgi:hypothetical protein